MLREPSLAGTALEPYYHVCSFFGSRDDEYRVLAPFYRETLDWGEKLLHVIDSRLRSDHVARLEHHHVDVCRCLETQQFQIVGWKDTYLRGGVFDQELMLGAVQHHRGVVPRAIRVFESWAT